LRKAELVVCPLCGAKWWSNRPERSLELHLERNQHDGGNLVRMIRPVEWKGTGRITASLPG
jgi:hypothetical protein